MFKVFLIFSIIVIVSSESNETCNDGRICFTYQSLEEHCEILMGPECFPPCEIKQCSIRVENDVMCDHYLCTPKPANKSVLNFFLGAFGSMTTSVLCIIIWRIYRKWNQRGFLILENQDDESNITGRENEGDANTRPIIRQGSTSSLPSTSQVSSSSPLPTASSQPDLSQPGTSRSLENENFKRVKVSPTVAFKSSLFERPNYMEKLRSSLKIKVIVLNIR